MKNALLKFFKEKQLTTAKSLVEKEVKKYYSPDKASQNFVFLMSDCILHAEFPEYFDQNGEYLMGNTRKIAWGSAK